MNNEMEQKRSPVPPAGVSRRSLIAGSLGFASGLALAQHVSAQHADHGVAIATPALAHDATGDLGVEGQDLIQPEIRASIDGVLETTLLSLIHI